MDLVVYPDTDALARSILLSGLASAGVTGIAVATRLPSPMQNRFVRLYTIPGRESSRRTQSCQVIALVYDTKGNDVRCREFAGLCAAVLRSAVEQDYPISGPAELRGPFPSEDPDLPGVPRYQVNVTWTVQSTVTSA